MARHVSDIAFTPAVKAQQDRLGSRVAYARMEGPDITPRYTVEKFSAATTGGERGESV